MAKPIIEVENLSKLYQLGSIGATTFYESVERWWYRMRKKEEMLKKIGTRHRMIGPDDPQAGPRPNTLWALKDVSFTVNQGEIIGIIGKNGAGKSTLLKILSRITEPTEGYAVLRGRTGSLLEVGTGFHPELTGRENIYLNGAILGMRKAEIKRKFDEIVAFAEIDKFLDTPLKRYSSGMYVRLAFAVAAHLEPEILFVDEVLAVGDLAFQKKCLGKMGEVAKEGRTILFVSHNIRAIKQLCQKAILLNEGHLVSAGYSSEVTDLYMQDTVGIETPKNVLEVISRLPLDPVFRLKSIAVLQDGHFVTNILNGKPVVVQIEYDVLQEAPGFHLYFELYDMEEILLFESVHNGDADEIPTVMPGTYISRAIIPGDFLAPIQYELRVSANIFKVRHCIPEPIRILLNVQATGRINRAYPGSGIPGKLAPLLKWTTEQLR